MAQSKKTPVKKPARKRRGFLLMMVVGVLAVLLATVIGFLGFTRGETNAVATIRDKADGADILMSSMDWMIANLCNDLMTANSMDESKNVSSCRNPGDADYKWWYKTLEVGTNTWLGWMGNPASPVMETKWMYLPDNYFVNGQAVRARFSVQVLDANSVPHVNDFLEDGNPTQCQQAHILQDGFGKVQMEKYRYYRDTADNAQGYGGWWNGQAGWTKLRYHEAWRMATKTVRSMHWPSWYFWDGLEQEITQTWMTTNTTWQGLYGVEYDSLKTNVQADGIPLLNHRTGQATNMYGSPFYWPPTAVEGNAPDAGQGNTLGTPGGYSWGNNQSIGFWYFTVPYSLYAYTDPDTGRSPINVNTAYNDGEPMPTNIFSGIDAYSFQAAMNTASISRILKVGKMYAPDLDGTSRQLDISTIWAPIAGTAILTTGAGLAATTDNYMPGPLNGIHYLRLVPPGPVTLTGLDSTGLSAGYTILLGNMSPTNTLTLTSATATSAPANQFAGAWGAKAILPGRYVILTYDGTAWRVLPWVSTYRQARTCANRLAFKYQEVLVRYFTMNYDEPFSWGYGCPLPAPWWTGQGPVGTAHQVTMNDYSKTRFQGKSLSQFRQDFRDDLAAMGTGVFSDGSPDSQATVNFDGANNPLVNPGKVDERVCNAIFDNAVPGKPGFSGMPAFPFATGNPDIDDPLFQLYTQRLGRDETVEDTYSRADGYWDDNTNLFDGTFGKAGSDGWHAGQGGGAPPADLVGPRNDHTNPGIGAKTVRAKGLDIWQCTDDIQPDNCPYRKVAHVPSRQLTFGPDWFSTEFTTTSTTFYLVINAQIVKTPTGVGAAPGQSDKPIDIFWSTWMVVVELAPDVKAETPAGYAPGVGNLPGQFDLWDTKQGLGYYRSGAPFARKTNGYIMDGQPLANPGFPNPAVVMGNVNLIPRYKFGAFSIRDTLTAPGWGFIRTAVPELYTASARWVDFRGFKPATDPDASGYPAGTDSASAYVPAKQTKKRVIIRAIWSLNQGMK